MAAKLPGGLDPVARELVGIAAAVASQCRPCFIYHYNEALDLAGR